MNRITKILLATGSIIAIAGGSLVVHAGGWDNFKLRYFHLTSHLNEQNQELNDIRKQGTKLEESSRITLSDLLNGGPPKDGIPSIDNPQFDTSQTTPFKGEETVIGVVINGEAKAYPFGIMNWHEIVNDTVGGKTITITYCPLCDTMVVFERHQTTFGVSGKLYQSCLVMYDRTDDTLYSQPWAMGIIGAKVDQHLDRLPAVKTTLAEWLREHPESQILSTNTGHIRDYQNYPYGSYYTDDNIIFPVRNQDRQSLPPKTIVSYIWESDDQTPRDRFSGESLHIAHQELEQIGEKMVTFNGREIRLVWDERMKTARFEEMDGQVIPSTTAFAFVYPAYFE
ncbi:DUF3179 domain-containing protein [Roseofilum reptotaenium CS-1145]|uniref:DUF3179 domain-containing protein n=1 Tax=Roseofilum reptotaenium AO1-A TaxID=1925591 RepID=A0A1L9QKE6_9CYAN|nr:DUF3179 domain-containing protein [Roseofilum reptotaenium]MDB9515606.1 DUF3179 domain-containing protein [Roseofilum reptotaenium CS-1145]OJJ16532.1 hypothetical protein BI308_23490 [Roseofilum reptotaenium AO1-A]